MPEDQMSWEPGDVANGHVLTEHGYWVPLPPAPGQQERPSGPDLPPRRHVFTMLYMVGSAHSLDGKTCPELTTEMLKMTGVDATEDYDLARVREINAVRRDKGCA